MKYTGLFITVFIFWLLLTFNLSAANIITGVIAAVITSIFFGKFFIDKFGKLFQLKRYYWFVVYLFIFLWEILKANFDVAYRVIHPAMPIKPGIVKVPLEIRSDIARTMLANSITMTPGTITVDIIGDDIFVHWIYVKSDKPEEYAREVSGRFEKYIKKIFE